IKEARRELDLTKQSKLVPIKPDERGGISSPLKHYETAYPFGTQPGDENLMLHIAGWTIKETTKKKWFNEGEQDFINCPNLEPWMRCSYSSNRNA
ncbi:hypothetical protein P5E70_16035, partial [Clostridium perfringens]|nr:hypothetical protein [Clostridium perfringens]